MRVQMTALLLPLFLLNLWGLLRLDFQTQFNPKAYLSPQEQSLGIANALQGPEHLLLLTEFPSSPSQPTLHHLSRKLKDLPNLTKVLGPDSLPGNQDHFFQVSENKVLFVLEQKRNSHPTLSENRERINSLRKSLNLIAKETGFKFQIAGKSLSRQELHTQLKSEILFPVAAIAAVILILPLIIYQHWLFLVVPACLGLWVLSVTLGLYGFFGSHFGYFSLTLIPLILCLCLLDCLFLLDRFSQLGGRHEQPMEAARKDILPPALMTTLSTSLGFLALYFFSQTPVIQEYAVFAFTGVWVAWISTFFLLPPFFPCNFRLDLPNPAKGLDQFCRRVISRSITHRKYIQRGLLVIVLSLLPFLGKVDPTPPRLLAPSHPYQKTVDTLRSHLGTLLPIQFTIKVKPHHSSDNGRHLLYSYGFERWLHNEKLAKHTLSPLQVVDLKKMDVKSRKTPEWRKWAGQSEGFLEVDENSRITSLSFLAWLIDDTSQTYERLLHYLNHYERTMMAEFTYEMSGPFALNKAIERRFVKEAVFSFAFVLLVICLLAYLAIRDIPLWLVFLAVNLAPLILLVELMGLFGIPFHLGIIGLPAILLGVIVDDSIHILWQFRKTEEDPKCAIHVGRAVLLSSLLLMIGIGGQIFSGYGSNIDFGVIGGVGVFLALVFDLSVLPTLLYEVREYRRKTRKLPQYRPPQPKRPLPRFHLPVRH